MRVYLAAPYAARDRLRFYADELASMSIEVTSRWIREDYELTDGVLGTAPDLDDRTAARHASADFEDIDRAEVFVLFTEGFLGVDGRTGGRHIETGYAIAHSLVVFVVGEPENIFHRSDDVTICPAWTDARGQIVSHFLALARANGAER